MFIRELLPVSTVGHMLNLRTEAVKDLMLLGVLEYTTTHSMNIYVYKDSVDNFLKGVNNV